MTITVEHPSASAAPVAFHRHALRAVIYARVSQDPRQQLRSVSQQVDECTAECKRRGWTVARVFTDNDRSASRYATKQRPEYGRLIDFLRAGNADVLVTWESSRAQRDLEAYVRLRKVAEENGVQWSYKGRLYDLSRTDDRFTTGLDALLDERESSVTRDRILRDKRAHALKGLPGGQVPFGYRREYDPHTKTLLRQVVREDQAAVVREAARRIAAGETCYTVAQDFNRRGTLSPTGKNWYHRTIRELVTRHAYIGKRVHQGKVIGDAVWPPILDDATFYACTGRFSNPARRNGRPGKIRYLLSSIVRCDVCGGRVVAAMKPGQASVYNCLGKKSANGANGRMGCVSLNLALFDKHITALVIERLARPDAAELVADGRRADDAVTAMGEAAEKRARLEEFADAAARGDLSPAALARVEERLLPEIEAAEKRAAVAQVDPVLRDVVRPDIGDIWENLPLTQRREVITALMDISLTPSMGRVMDTRRIKIAWKHDL
jgi:site-specific DNA recombinase